LKHNTLFFIEYVTLDLLMDQNGACCGVMAWCLEDGTLHRFRAQQVVLATGGMRGSISFARAPTPARATVMPWRSELDYHLKTWNLPSSTRPDWSNPVA
jgi:succinate dehydrogenase/fumarate reductase flavoprotein subunit